MIRPEASNFGDLDAIRARGMLRVLVRSAHSGLVLTSAERSLIQQFAESQGLESVWIGRRGSQLLDALHSGAGDMAVGGSTQTGAGVRQTLAWGVSRQQVVARTDTGRIRDWSDLATRQIVVRRSSPVWLRLEAMAREHAGMEIVEVPEALDTAALLAGVESGRYDLAVVDSIMLQTQLSGFLDLHIAYDLTEDESRSWAVREDSVTLLDSLNRFLNKKHLEIEMARIYRADFPEIQDRKLLRLITYQSPVNYYFDRGRLRGFEYELARRFTQRYQIRLDVVIARSHDEMRRLLLEGRGDLIAASLPRDSYAGDHQVAYTSAVNYSAPVIVGRRDDTSLADARDLDGRRIALPQESPYREALQRLQAHGIGLQIVDVEPGLNTEATLFRVAHGMYDLTLIGGHQVKSEFSRQLHLKAHFALSEPQPLAWGVRRSDTKLRTALNEFLSREFRKGYYNMLYAKYVESPGPGQGNAHLLARVDRLSPYDEIVHEYAERYDFDWRLIVAQMFQESAFEPDALSDAGAAGLMQILPQTAEHLGVADPNDPHSSIHAGIRYLDYLRGEFEEELLLEDRTWFTLAAYNAGLGRVRRARDLAREMHLDGDRWFDNVELAMLAMAKPYTRDGELVRNCRCGQAVVYVRDIRTRYNNYVRLTSALRTADAIPAPGSRI